MKHRVHATRRRSVKPRSREGLLLAALHARLRGAADPDVLDTGEGRLCFAALMRRVSDLAGICEHPKRVYRAQAVEFFRNQHGQLWVAEAVGLDPLWVQESVRRVLDLSATYAPGRVDA